MGKQGRAKPGWAWSHMAMELGFANPKTGNTGLQALTFALNSSCLLTLPLSCYIFVPYLVWKALVSTSALH